MKINRTLKITATLLLPFGSALLFFVYPAAGLYFSCISAFALAALHIRLKKPARYGIASLLAVLTFALFVRKATELQGQQLVGELMHYYDEHKKAPGNLSETGALMVSSFNPSFSGYQYSSTPGAGQACSFRVSYTDFWGNSRRYCVKCGDFESRERAGQKASSGSSSRGLSCA